MIWYILGGILLFILLLLIIPVRVFFDYADEGATAYARYILLRFPLYPAPDKPAKPGKEEPEPAAKEKRGAKTSFFDLLQTINDMLPEAGRMLGRILRGTVLYRCRVSAVVSGKDAAETAIRYGRANALLYCIYAALCNAIRVKEFAADIGQDYMGGEEKAEIHAAFRMTPLIVLGAGIGFMFRGGAALLPKKDKSGKAKVNKA